MNKLTGEITAIETHEDLSLISIQSGNVNFSVIVIETPATSENLQIGRTTQMLFKETEVILANGNDIPISLQNRVNCTIEKIEQDKLLSKIIMSSDLGKVVSVITTNAKDQLQLKEGNPIVAMVKTNEIMLQND